MGILCNLVYWIGVGTVFVWCSKILYNIIGVIRSKLLGSISVKRFAAKGVSKTYAIVTGAGGGIGQGFSEVLASKGWKFNCCLVDLYFF
jgi:hypothetical protein